MDKTCKLFDKPNDILSPNYASYLQTTTKKIMVVPHGWFSATLFNYKNNLIHYDKNDANPLSDSYQDKGTRIILNFNLVGQTDYTHIDKVSAVLYLQPVFQLQRQASGHGILSTRQVSKP